MILRAKGLFVNAAYCLGLVGDLSGPKANVGVGFMPTRGRGDQPLPHEIRRRMPLVGRVCSLRYGQERFSV